MTSRVFRIITIIISFFFLTGFVPFSIIGPSVTVLTSGNIYKAGAQFIINQRIEKETGKNSLTLIKEKLANEEIEEKIQKNSFNEDLKKLVETRIKMTRKKLNHQNLEKIVKKRINVTRSILNLNITIQ